MTIDPLGREEKGMSKNTVASQQNPVPISVLYLLVDTVSHFTAVVIIICLELSDVSLEHWNIPYSDSKLSSYFQSVTTNSQLLDTGWLVTGGEKRESSQGDLQLAQESSDLKIRHVNS